jgi:two-component system, chemotaxis family, chemotaxis protein CheY
MRSLVVDDEFVALSKMVAILEPLGQCDAATNAEQALAFFLKALKDGAPYDLITIDINIPSMSGLTLLNRFQSEEKSRGCQRARKIVASADSSPFNVRSALANDCDGFLVKPVSRSVLMDKLAALQLLPSGVSAGSAESAL